LAWHVEPFRHPADASYVFDGGALVEVERPVTISDFSPDVVDLATLLFGPRTQWRLALVWSSLATIWSMVTTECGVALPHTGMAFVFSPMCDGKTKQSTRCAESDGVSYDKGCTEKQALALVREKYGPWWDAAYARPDGGYCYYDWYNLSAEPPCQEPWSVIDDPW